MDRTYGTCGRQKTCIQSLVGKPEGKRPLERHNCTWEDNINIDLQEIVWGIWTGLSWLRNGTGGEFLCAQTWNFEFHKTQESSFLTEELQASQVELYLRGGVGGSRSAPQLWYNLENANPSLCSRVRGVLVTLGTREKCNIDVYCFLSQDWWEQIGVQGGWIVCSAII
jgi:hypothetical protein